MPREDEAPQSPTALGMQTGMAVPGLPNAGVSEGIRLQDAADVRGTLEEALLFPPQAARDDLDAVVPGQSGAEGLAELPWAGPDDPADGP